MSPLKTVLNCQDFLHLYLLFFYNFLTVLIMRVGMRKGINLYVLLPKMCFDTVEIEMMIDTGDPVPFPTGKSFVVLEFRRVIHP